jgi:prolyl oligopeptidase
MRKYIILSIVLPAFLLIADTSVVLKYPETKRVNQIDDYHGAKVADPYRWLEDLDSRETADWVAAQNELSIPFLEGINRRETIKNRLTELWNYERYGIPFEEGGKYFYSHNDGLQNQNVLYISESLKSTPKNLIDPNTFSKDATVSLRRYAISNDGKYIAYAISDGGSDWTTWKVRNTDTGEDSDDFLTYTKFTTVSWSYDNAGFYYSRYPVGTDGKGDGSKPVSIYYHLLGTSQSEDKLVYDLPDQPLHNPYGKVSHDGHYLVITISKGFQTNAVHVMDLTNRDTAVIRLFDQWDAKYSVLGNDGSEFYVKTNKDAPMGRVIAVNLNNPQSSAWREIVPQSQETMQSAYYVGGAFTTRYLTDAKSNVRIFERSGKLLRNVELPGVGSAYGFWGEPDDTETFYYFTGYTTPPSIYRYDLESGESTLFAEAKLKDVDLDVYQTKQIFYNSKDGTRIPMFITHRKGIDLNGENPTLLYGYGGFNVSLTPNFSASYLVWLEMGGVLAVPNLRGGGEYGESWHLAGTKLNKQNVFDDFIAAAEWLIENDYTSSKKLAIFGGSNGGLLVGACITQRPELFGAAIPIVGVLDMLRYHLPSANAYSWSSDYGLSDNIDEFRALYKYSPYHNIKDRTCFPPTLITTADHDDRVVPWHSFKFGAALQHAQGCKNPVLLRVETRAGHGSGTPTWMRIENTADRWAFLVQNLQME